MEAPTTTVGNATATAESSGDILSSGDVAGVLIVPDIEARRGWREYFVKHPAKPNGRAIGFRR